MSALMRITNLLVLLFFILNSCILQGRCADPVAPDTVARAYSSLLNLKCDKAIGFATPALIADCRKSVTNNRGKIARDLLIIGWAFMADGNTDAAQQVFLMVSAVDPSNTLAPALFVQTAMRNAEEIPAATFNELLPLADKSAMAACCIGKLYAIRDDVNAAEKYLRKAMELAPGMAYPHYLLARLYAEYGTVKQMTHQYEIAAKLEQSPYQAELFKGNAAISDKDEKAHYVAAGKIAPDDPVWHVRMALMLQQQDEDRQADGEFQKALNCPRLSASSFLKCAARLADTHRVKEALSCLDYLEERHPGCADVNLMRANIWNYWAGKPLEAIAEYEKGITRNPDIIWLYTGQSDAFFSMKNKSGATAAIKRIALRRPRNAIALRRLASVYKACGEWTAAQTYYTAARNINPAVALDPAHKQESAAQTCGIAYCLYKLGDIPAAETEAVTFNKVKDFTPLPPAIAAMGFRFRPERLRFDSPVTSTDHAVARTVALADVLFEERDYAGAEIQYRKALQLQPENIDLHMYLFSTLTEKGDWPAALQEDIILANKMVNSAPKRVAEMQKRLTGPDKSQSKKAQDKPIIPIQGASAKDTSDLPR
jgi:tetratricopeptide (TPR) repeat protein